MGFYGAATLVVEHAGLSGRKGNSVREMTRKDLEAPNHRDSVGTVQPGARESLTPSDP